MSLDLITGHQGVSHISAEQISTINKAMMDGYGDNKVMRMKNGTLTQDGLTIEIATGYWRANGFDIELQEAETVYIDPTGIGTSRIDNVYVELLQDIPTGAQRAEIVTIQGEEAASPTAPDDPTDPYLNTDILLEAVKLASVTVTEGAMVLTDLSEDYDIVTPAELQAVSDQVTALAGDVDDLTANKASKNDFASISITGTTNNTGSTITEDTYFYLNGNLVKALADIANGATLTANTNYEVVTAGGLNDAFTSLKASLSNKQNKISFVICTKTQTLDNYAPRVRVPGFESFSNYPTGKTILARIPLGIQNSGDQSYGGYFTDVNNGWAGYILNGAQGQSVTFRLLVIYLS